MPTTHSTRARNSSSASSMVRSAALLPLPQPATCLSSSPQQPSAARSMGWADGRMGAGVLACLPLTARDSPPPRCWPWWCCMTVLGPGRPCASWLPSLPPRSVARSLLKWLHPSRRCSGPPPPPHMLLAPSSQPAELLTVVGYGEVSPQMTILQERQSMMQKEKCSGERERCTLFKHQNIHTVGLQSSVYLSGSESD